MAKVRKRINLHKKNSKKTTQRKICVGSIVVIKILFIIQIFIILFRTKNNL